MTEADRDLRADASYVEVARGFRSVAWSALAVVLLFVLDLVLEGSAGALAHLPGWIIAGVLLVGTHVLLLHAVRSTHSLAVTGEQLVIGDEAVARSDIVGVRRGGGAGDDLPTLGWPNGFPRGSKALTVRLADDRDVLVPTRYPDRLQAALGIGEPAPEAAPVVREAAAEELAGLEEIDDRAETIFRVAGYDLSQVAPADPCDPLVVLVAGTPPLGFARLAELDGAAHLDELAVLPSAMRRGVGSGLLEAASSWAGEHGYPALTLTTFADVAWNAPFYAARGFVEVDDPGPGLRAVRQREAGRGLDAVGRRIVMSRPLAPSTPAG